MCKNYQHEGSICNHLWPLGVPGHLCLVDSEKWALLHVSTRTKPIMVIHGLYFAIPERRQEYWDICIRVHCCIGLHGKGTSNWGPKNGQLRSWNCVSKTSRSSLPRTKMRWRFGGGTSTGRTSHVDLKALTKHGIFRFQNTYPLLAQARLSLIYTGW